MKKVLISTLSLALVIGIVTPFANVPKGSTRLGGII